MKLLVIDGNSIINRAFYGIKLLTTKDGRYTNGVYGFINILNRLCEMESPDGVAVAFDLKKPTFRHEMYDAYKAGRHGMPDELASQLPILKEYLTLAGHKCIECPGYEADDIIGTLAYDCEKNGNTCVIATGDRDSLQLVSDKTRVLLTATKMGRPEIINYDKQALFEKYGLTPDEMIELKSLMGDSSDNIPGVAGVGEKTATDLITRFHSIDYIYENIDTIDVKEGVRQKLRDGKENAYLSRKLGTICKSAPIDVKVCELSYKGRDDSALASLMTSLEFFKLMEKMGITPCAAPVTESKTEARSLTVANVDEILTGKTVDIYTEEDSFVLVSEDKICKAERDVVSNLLADENIEKRVYDYKALCKEFEKSENIVFDAVLAGYLCNPSSSDYSLQRLSQEYSVAQPEINNEVDCILNNAALFSEVCNKLGEKLIESGEEKLLKEIEIPLAKVLSSMEKEGFLVDREGLENMGNELEVRIADIQEKIYSLVGYEFNLNSPKQLGVALFEKLGLPAKKKTKSGYSTNAEVLESLKYAHPAVELLLEYRQLAKLKSTYCDGLVACIAEDNRIHTTFNQTEARTGRISSLEPNLQNIPVRTNEGKRLREFFTAKEGFVLCDADYSQIELRVLASMSKDENMISSFNSGVDIHTVTASQVFGMPIDMVTPVMRSRAKAVNFGIVYGIGAFSLAKDIGVTRAEADGYIKSYLAAYPEVSKYMEDTIADAKQNGFVTTAFGRRRYLPELSSSNGMLRAFGERVARNAPIQGTAADIIKIAMIKVYRRLEKEIPEAKLILQVHDELIVECPEKDAERVCKILSDEMESSADMAVKLTADASFGKNWLEAKE